MASVFLSYAREDAAKTKTLAAALERAGHEIWWDRHLQGGSRFADEIDAALKRADAVVVLWSKSSVRSAWVQDEAAAGRDTDRLVPVLLESAEPPLGFRQFHTIDLSNWKPRRKPPHFEALLAAISAKQRPSSSPELGPVTVAETQTPTGCVRPVYVALSVLALVVLSLLGWRYWESKSAGMASAPTLAVLPFADLSPEKDKSFFAEGIAEAILSTLGRQPGLKVIGRTSAAQFKDGTANLEQIRRALGVTHVLEGSARTSGSALRVNVRLIDVSDGSQIWSEEYQRGIDNVFAVQDEIGRSVAQRLRGSLARQVAPVQSAVTGAETYGLYLAARAKLRDRKLKDVRDAITLTKEVIASDPGYGPAYALYADAVFILSRNSNSRMDPTRAIEIAKRYARRAIQLSPQSADGYAALGIATAIDDPGQATGPLTRAVELDPTRAETRHRLAGAYNRLDRGKEAMENYRAAHEIEPLWGHALGAYVDSLAANGRFAEADSIVRNFAERGGAPAFVARARVAMMEERGDLSEALRFAKLTVQADPELGTARETLAFWYHLLDLGTPAEVERLLSGSALFYQLHATERYRELNNEARRLGPRVWNHPEAEWIISALAETREWDLLARLYALRTSSQPLCLVPRAWVEFSLSVAIALQHSGRAAEAGALLACVDQRLSKLDKASTKTAFLSRKDIRSARAELLALQGKLPAAFKEMNEAIDLGFRARHGAGLTVLPAFDRLRGTHEYRAMDERLKSLTARERQEALQQ